MSASDRAAALRAVAGHDGIARLRDLRDAGHSRRTIDGMRADGSVINAGRGWVALPGADTDLVAAARAGIVLTCVTAAAQPWSDAGLETYVLPRLRWLRLPLRRQTWLYGHRVDLLIGDRLVLQIDGGSHVGRQRESDIAHDAELRLRGYTVFRVGYRQVIHDWPAVQDLLMRAVAQGLHQAS